MPDLSQSLLGFCRTIGQDQAQNNIVVNQNDKRNGQCGGVEATTLAHHSVASPLHSRGNNDMCYLFFCVQFTYCYCVGKLGSRGRPAHSFAKISLHMWSIEIVQNDSTNYNAND